jgi:arsenite methyltransferase
MRSKVDYGQDAPGLLRDYLLKGTGFVIAGILVGWLARNRLWRVVLWAGRFLHVVGWFWLIKGILMIWSSRVVKIWAAEDLLDGLNLQGNESILDVGCGRGLLLIKAAKRLPHGRAVGLDLWSVVDQGKNTRAATLTNARSEGVLDRVELHDGDMRALSFVPDASLDAVVASKSIHNIPTREGRRQAIEEIVRVLKAGGKVALMDIFLIEEVAEHLRACDMQGVTISPPNLLAYPPLQIVTGRKGVQ